MLLPEELLNLFKIILMMVIVAGKEVLPYVGPRPPVGIHRYILVLFQQKAPLGFLLEVRTYHKQSHFVKEYPPENRTWGHKQVFCYVTLITLKVSSQV